MFNLLLIILSIPSKAPPAINNILDVFNLMKFWSGCFLPPLGGTFTIVPSINFNNACWTPSPDTSLVIDANTLRNILTEPKNALTKQYIRLFEIDNIELTFTNQALDYIVEKAVEFKLGARGLRSICETILIDDMFNLPGSKTKKLIVDKSYIVSKLDDTNFTDLKEAS